MIKSRELTPFIDSLQYLSGRYHHGEPRELYDYRGKELMFATTGIWNHPVRNSVDFDINLGEYLALMLDNPPMTDWIADWHDNVMPKMFDEMKQYLKNDTSALTPEQLNDISLSAEHLTKFCLPAADTPEKQAELWRAYELTRELFLNHIDALSESARGSIEAMEREYSKRVKS